MMAERTDPGTRASLWSPPPSIAPDVRSRWTGIVPALLMAVVVAGPSLWLTWLILANNIDEDAPTRRQLSLFVFCPAFLISVVLVPSLAVGRWPGRMTAVPGKVWLAIAALLFIVPGLGLASMQVVGESELAIAHQPESAVDWEFGVPDGSSIIAALFGALVIVGIGAFIGYLSRDKGRYAAILAVPIATILSIFVFAIFFFASLGSSLGAQSEPTPDAGLLGLLPLVTWIAVPSVAVLGGAELWAEEDRR